MSYSESQRHIRLLFYLAGRHSGNERSSRRSSATERGSQRLHKWSRRAIYTRLSSSCLQSINPVLIISDQTELSLTRCRISASRAVTSTQSTPSLLLPYPSSPQRQLLISQLSAAPSLTLPSQIISPTQRISRSSRLPMLRSLRWALLSRTCQCPSS